MTLFSSKTAHILLLFLLSAYCLWWLVGNRAMLVNPNLQTDDVMTHIFAFHRYTGNAAMADDPIASEVLNMMPPGVRIVYQLIVPLTGVPVSTKVVQGLCLCVLVLGVYVLARRGGAFLASAALLLFFTLHTPSFIGHIVGGLQRAFALPCFIVWVSGAFLASPRIRVAALVVSAVTYPVALALLFVAEGYLSLLNTPWHADTSRHKYFVSGVKRYIILLLACLLLLTPYQILTREAGPAHSLSQAQQEPAFSQAGRIRALPFADPWRFGVHYFVSPLRSSYDFLASRLSTLLNKKRLDDAVAIGFLGLVFLGVWFKIIPVPKIALSLLLAAISMYVLSRVFAFHFYFPRRYLQYGFPMACITLIAETLPQLHGAGLLLAKVKSSASASASSWLASVIIMLTLILGGDGIKPGLMISIDKREHYALYEFFSRLPDTTRVAAHPNDGDDIPFWSGRPTTGGFETLQPWFVDSWRRQKAFTEELLSALYATDWPTLLDFCQKYEVTHLLVQPQRYGPYFRQRAEVFEPFGSYVKTLLSSVEVNDLVMIKALQGPIVFRDRSFLVIEVERLRALAKHNKQAP